MKIKRKRRIKKQVKVIFGLFLIIILIGGIGFMLSNNKNKVTKETKKKEDIITTNGDVSEEKKEIKSTPSNNSEFKNLEDGEYQTSKGYTLEIKNGIAYIDGNIIVNKTYSLPSDYVPSDPYEAITNDRGINNINKDVMAAFKLMQSDATSIGLNLYISSGYRGYNTQDTLYNNYVLKDGKDAADKYSARAGSSEHQSGTCFDLNTIDDSFASTDEGKWVNENAYLYGFIIRFPKGKEDETGYQYESWHLRYVGLELAKKLYNNGDWIAIEDYYGLSSVY